jgi:thioredoxin 1
MNEHLKSVVSVHPAVLLDFHAVWCEPCKWVEPILDQVVNHFGERISLQKIDIDEHPDIARDLHILSVPTIVLFKNGTESWRIRGFDTAPHLIKTIENVL